MTGRRPDTTRVWNAQTNFRKTVGDKWQSLPQVFKNQGYETVGHGKIYHDGKGNVDPLSWSQPFNIIPADECNATYPFQGHQWCATETKTTGVFANAIIKFIH